MNHKCAVKMQHAILPLSCRLSVPVRQSICSLPLRSELTQNTCYPTQFAPFVDQRCRFLCEAEAYLIIGGCLCSLSAPHSIGLCQFSNTGVATSIILILARLDAVLPTRNISARCFVPYGILVNNFSGVKTRGRLTTWQKSCPSSRPVCNQARPPHWIQIMLQVLWS
jgi:hypothetical protein